MMSNLEPRGFDENEEVRGLNTFPSLKEGKKISGFSMSNLRGKVAIY